MTTPAISIISPVYNAAPYLEPCVQSLAKQTLDNLEYVFVDDGSTDDSLAVLQRLAETEPRLKVFHKENGGAASARNLGLKEATGEFLFFLDADDYIPDDTALEQLYNAAKKEGVAIAGGSMCIDRDGVVDYESMHGSALDSFAEYQVMDYADYQYDYDFTRYIYSRALLEEHGITFPNLTQFEDPVFFVNAMIAAERFVAVPVTVYAYRYGHQKRTWREREVLDRTIGMEYVLKVSKEHGYATLHMHATNQLAYEMTYVYLEHLGNNKVLHEIFKAQGLIDTELIRQADPDFPEDFIIEPLAKVRDDYLHFMNMRETTAGKIGRKVLGVSRKLKGNGLG